MPGHWHALIWTGYPLTISQVIHDVKKVSARKVQARRGTQAAFWQHQVWDRFVRHGKEFNDRLAYLHLNPVRKGLVAEPEEWRWSSYNNFAPTKPPSAAVQFRSITSFCPKDTGRDHENAHRESLFDCPCFGVTTTKSPRSEKR